MNNSSRAPDRTYYFSDCYGGTTGDPLRDPDPDALISTDFRANPSDRRHREFDTFHSPGITPHILRTVLSLHEEMAGVVGRERLGVTGLMINGAPRTEKGPNGEHFYLAELGDGAVRVVAPIDALAPVKDKVETLRRLPHRNNLHGEHEQFRSSYVPRLLQPDHDINLEDADPRDIPDPDAEWKVAYVDRFGNVITFSRDQQSLLATPESIRDGVRVKIGETVRNVNVGTSLDNAEPGAVTIYGNFGNIDLARKWEPGETPADRLSQSAYAQFGRPNVGTNVSIIREAA